jgi:integrase/recombinase XerD
MRRRKPRQTRTGRGWDLPQNALSHALAEFLDWSGAAGISPRTIRQRQRALRRFILWAEERGLANPAEVTLPILERYQRHLYHYRKPDGAPLTFASQYAELVPVKSFFKWLVRSRYILYNPAAELIMPKVMPSISGYVLTVADVEAILNATDTTTMLGIRDRAILETLYSSAIRRAELLHLSVFDVDTRRGSLLVREGKGRRDRLVPLGERACAWVERYLLEVRPELVAGHDAGVLFLSQFGEPFHDYSIGELVKRYIAKAGVPAKGACHLFRHACATHMLENGADTRYIQAMLGHSNLSSTQIYTHVALTKLKEIHTATHPARLKRARSDAGQAGGSDKASSSPGSGVAQDEILAALEADGREDEAEEDNGPAAP